MERNVLELVAAKISSITLRNASNDSNDTLTREFLEETCCRNRKRVECYDHFLNNALMYIITENLRSRNLNAVYGTVFFVADMAKNEIGREFLSNIHLVCLLVDKIKRERNYFIRLQTCRALANMCYDHVKTQRMIMGQDPVDDIFIFLDMSSNPRRRENNERFKEVVVALILNLLADNQRMMEEIADKYIPNLIHALEVDLSSRIPPTVAQNLFVAIVTLTEIKSPEEVFTFDLCLTVVDMFRKTTVFDYTLPGLEFLEDSELPDITKYQLVQAGLFEVLLLDLEHKPENLGEDDRKKYEMVGRVLANILSGDDAMTYVYNMNNARVINYFGAWLLSEDRDTVHTGALCLGNVARSDTNSLTIVERGIHRNLISIVHKNTDDVRILYAIVSALRNLCLPKENKKILMDAGVLEVLLSLLDLEIRTSSPVIYKAIGAVRQTIEGNEEMIFRLGTDGDLVRQMVHWSSATLLPWVSTECARLLCSMVIESKDRNVIINMLENRAYTQISRMLTALHGIMQIEALICMTITVNAALNELSRDDLDQLPEEERRKSEVLTNFHILMIECELGDKVRHLIAQHGVKMEQNILEECLTFLETALKVEPLRIHFFCEGIKGVVHYVLRSRQDFEQIRPRVEAIENACRFF